MNADSQRPRLVARFMSPAVAAGVLVAAVATMAGFGTLHHLQNADSIVMVLVSLQHWTPFFWGQNRAGMLVPLLALPVRDPLANLLLQGCLTTAAALATPFVAARYLVGPRPRLWFPAGAVANVLLLLVASPEARFDWFVTAPYYGVGLFISFIALITLQRPSALAIASSAVLLVLAHWVNATIGVLLVPLILFRNRGAFDNSVAFTLIGLVAGWLFSDLSTAPHTPASFSTLTQWPQGSLQLVRVTIGTIAHPAVLAVSGVCAALGAILLGRRRAPDPTMAAVGCATATAVLYWMFVGGLEWVRLNSYYPRYVFPSLMLFELALSLLIVAPWQHRGKTLAVAAAAALLVAEMIDYRVPSRRGLERDLDIRFGSLTSDVLASQAAVIGGNYWDVWPAVFHANWTLRRQGDRSVVYGLADKSSSTDALWTSRSVVLAARPHDWHLGRLENQRALRLSLIEHRPTVDIFRVDARRP